MTKSERIKMLEEKFERLHELVYGHAEQLDHVAQELKNKANTRRKGAAPKETK